MKKFLLASNNEHKAKEFKEMLIPFDIEVITPKNLGIDLEPEENGKTFRENALIKAKAFYEICHIPTIADDSGLCIKALDEKPGIYSARFAKENGGYESTFAYLSKALENKIKEAKFHCCICLYDGESIHYFEGDCLGYLLDKPVGEEGFGYDPIFHSLEGDLDFGTAKEEEKNKYSHRSKALKKFRDYLNNENEAQND